MNNIAIKLEQIHFDKDTKDELNRFAETYTMKVEYYYDYISIFDKLNVHTISHHKIVFSKYGYDLLVLHYDEYHENDNLFIVDGEGYTLYEIKKYIRNYFKSNSNIKVKSNNK